MLGRVFDSLYTLLSSHLRFASYLASFTSVFWSYNSLESYPQEPVEGGENPAWVKSWSNGHFDMGLAWPAEDSKTNWPMVIGKVITYMGLAQEGWQRFPWEAESECLWMTEECLQRLATTASSPWMLAGELAHRDRLPRRAAPPPCFTY